MKELARNILQSAAVYVVSRYGVLAEQEAVTLTDMPRRGVVVTHMDRTDIRATPTLDCIQGLFTIIARERRRFTLENRVNRIRLSGVPRKSIRKIIGPDLYD